MKKIIFFTFILGFSLVTRAQQESIYSYFKGGFHKVNLEGLSFEIAVVGEGTIANPLKNKNSEKLVFASSAEAFDLVIRNASESFSFKIAEQLYKVEKQSIHYFNEVLCERSVKLELFFAEKTEFIKINTKDQWYIPYIKKAKIACDLNLKERYDFKLIEGNTTVSDKIFLKFSYEPLQNLPEGVRIGMNLLSCEIKRIQGKDDIRRTTAINEGYISENHINCSIMYGDTEMPLTFLQDIFSIYLNFQDIEVRENYVYLEAEISKNNNTFKTDYFESPFEFKEEGHECYFDKNEGIELFFK